MINKKLLSIFLLITFVLLATTVVSAADSSDGETAVQSDMQANTVSTSDHTSDSSSQATTSSNTQTTTNTHSNSETVSSTSDTNNAKTTSDTSSSNTNTEKTSDANTQATSNSDNTKTSDTQTTNTQTTTKDTTTSQSSVSDVKTSSSDTKEANNTLTAVSSNLVDEKTNLKTADPETVSSYTDLVSTIDNIKTGGTSGETYTILLEPGIIESDWCITETITWGDSGHDATTLIIDGQNQVTIDGQELNKFMTVSSGYTLTLQNITIVNCFSSSSGGAISNSGTLYIYNSELSSNTATDGGAIQNGGTLTINNTIFQDNTASDTSQSSYGAAGGGAIRNQGILSINGSTFTGNTATEDGGAIDNYLSNITINNTIFDSNIAGNAGGAIFSTGTSTENNITIERSTFTKNKALGTSSESDDGRGGAIYCYSTELNVTESEFLENSAALDGGAIFSQSGSTNINFTTFQENSASDSLDDDYGGGAICSSNNNLTVGNSTFIKNTCTNDGGAINIEVDIFTSNVNTIIANSKFQDNEAYLGGGIAGNQWSIMNTVTCTIENLTFIQNTASFMGGGMYYEAANSNDFILRNLTFYDNHAKEGGGLAASSTLGDTYIYDSKFYYNTAITRGGGYFDGGFSYNTNHYIYNSTFTGNTVNCNETEGYGGAIYGSTLFGIYYSNFTQNSALSSDYGGGAIAFIGEGGRGTGIISHCIFSENYGVRGSSILYDDYYKGTLSDYSQSHYDIIEYCTFSDDIGVYGTINTYNRLNVSYCSFTNNDETQQDSEYGYTYGSAIVLNGTNYEEELHPDFQYEPMVYINYTSFINLKADYGGAIFAGLEDSSSQIDAYIDINTCEFRNCSAKYGGAIYLDNVEAHITLSNFLNNTAEELGGAIFITGEYDNIEITLNYFEDNSGSFDNTIYTTFDSLLTITGNEIVRTDLTAQIYDTKRIYSPIDDQLDVERTDPELVKVTFIITDPDKNLRDEISAEYDHDIGFVYIDYEFDTLGIWTVKIEYDDSNNNIITLNVDVTPRETELTIDEITVESKDKVTITGTLKANSELLSSQEVYLYINDVQVDQTTTVNGKYTFTTDQSIFGYNKVEVRFEATGNYAESSATDHYTIVDTSTRTDSKVTVSSIDDITIGDSVTITGTLQDSNSNAISSGTVNVIVNGATRTATVKDGVYSVSGYKPSNTGTYIVTVVYNGNDVYNPSTASTKFNVDKLTTSVTVEKISDIKINNSVIITGILEDNNGVLANKDVIITINYETIITTTDENGRYYLNYTPSKTGSYSVLVEYLETSNSTGSYRATAFYTQKLDTTITVADITAKETETINLTAYVVDENNQTVNEGKVAFKLNDVTLKDENGDVIYVDVIDGVAQLEYTINNTAKNYTITGLYYGSDNYYTAKSDHGILEVQKANMTTTVLVDDITAQYMDTIEFVAQVIDEEKNIVTTGKVVFKLNGVSLKDENGDVIYVDIDEDGYARLEYTITNNPKIYNITAVYSGDEYYLTSRNETAILNVTNRVVNITVDSVSGKSGDTVQFKATITEDIPELAIEGSVVFKLNSVTLKDEDGNAIESEVIDGVATLDYEIPVDMAGKDYNITAVYSNKNYERSEANNTLTVERSAVQTSLTPLTTTEGTDARITAVLYDENGNQLERSTKVAIKINGKTVVHTTTENGVLNVTIPTEELSKGDYTIDVVFGENSAYTELRLNTTLSIV